MVGGARRAVALGGGLHSTQLKTETSTAPSRREHGRVATTLPELATPQAAVALRAHVEQFLSRGLPVEPERDRARLL